jgi:hypothetical protein
MLDGVSRDLLRERIEMKRRIDHETGCHVWTGTRHSNGAPRMRVRGSLHDTRRVVFYVITGSLLSDGARLRSTCGDSACLNPAHVSITEAVPIACPSIQNAAAV